MNSLRGKLLVVGFAGVALGVALSQRAARAQESFDKLSADDRQAMLQRFEKDVWPLMTRNGKDGCVGCHNGKPVSALKMSGKVEKDFAMLLKDGFLLPDDPGSLLGRITAKSPKRRMPYDKPAWEEKDITTLREFVAEVDKRQKKKK